MIISIRIFRIFCNFFLICLLFLPHVANASEQVIEKVTVTITGDQTPPNRIMKRMSASVATVGDQMLVGRSVGDVQIGKTSYEKLIQEIFDRVLVGYSVEFVRLNVGSTVDIQVKITPWGEVVRDVALEVDVGNLSPELAELVKNDMGNLEERVNEVLVGLPIDAIDWAGGVSKLVIREALATALPEFNGNFDIVPGTHTVMKLSLTPLGPTVQDVHILLRSRTIPNLLLFTVRPTAEQSVQSLVGLPVAFIERHRAYFTTKLETAAMQHSIAKNYGLQIIPSINPGVDTEITLDAETKRYKVSLEGYMDVGRPTENTSFRLHAGKFIGKEDEAFLEVDFIPSTVSWNFMPGWGHTISKGTTAGMKYNISDQYNILWLEHDVNQNMSVRFERAPRNGKNEFGIRYKMHDFLSAEYIVTKEEQWLRLISHL
ncbi:hypothetical protein [Pelosinus sp. sgz500959]|uniref:hypothetical protein n=1 Tax=Pelosinus sp. sgz500959 TaxID=3242472 RepID=UPI0036724CF6